MQLTVALHNQIDLIAVLIPVIMQQAILRTIVVGLDDGGINDYITNEESGFLVKDERDAAEKIEYLLNTPEKREQIHKAARKEAKEKINRSA